MIRELRDRSNISLLLYDARVTRHSSPRRGRWKSCVTGCGAISSVMRGAKRDVLREYDNYMIQKTFDPLSKTFYLESWGFSRIMRPFSS